MNTFGKWVGLCVLPLLAANGPAFAGADGAKAVRLAPATVMVSWQSTGPVDLYLADRPGLDISAARLISPQDRDGHQEVSVDGPARPYFLIKDRSDGMVTQVAERLVPLEQGSNFRDIGGYAGRDGKHVRWGMIYRSGATPLISADDQSKIAALGLRNLIDLRSSEERQLAPTLIEGVSYTAIGYRMSTMIPASTPIRNGAALYHNFPKFFAPQLRVLFSELTHGAAPLAYNCSAGQDRTGFATAMILSALGVPRAVIIQDYLLSTTYRKPAFEMPHIDLAQFPQNFVAAMFAKYQNMPGANTPQALIEADGTPFLAGAFAEIDSKWGSVDAYLKFEVGLTDQDIATLRRDYLE